MKILLDSVVQVRPVSNLSLNTLRCLHDNEAYYATGQIGCQVVFDQFFPKC
jgi:hypothetical protein